MVLKGCSLHRRVSNQSRALELNLDCAHELTCILTVALANSFASLREIAYDHEPSLVRVLNLHEIVKECMIQALERLDNLKSDLNPADVQLKTLKILAEAPQMETISEWKRAYRRFVACIAEYAYEGYGLLEKDANQLNMYARQKKLIASLHWRLLILNAREEGKLPTWEGIRIVCERIQEPLASAYLL